MLEFEGRERGGGGENGLKYSGHARSGDTFHIFRDPNIFFFMPQNMSTQGTDQKFAKDTFKMSIVIRL